MRFDILTLFPAMLESPLQASILGKAIEKGLITVKLHNLRDWAGGRHQVTDDTPYGGGDGMVMKVDPVAFALHDLKKQSPQSRILLMSPQGKPFRQADAVRYAREPGLIFVCGRYEGYDERIRSLVDEEVSLGDFVLTGGELAAVVILDATARMVPGVLGAEGSAQTVSAMACSNTRNIPAPQNSTEPESPKSCYPAITRPSPGGDAANSCSAPWNVDRSFSIRPP
jgi:tRNA (guanine37-N1)-methyltransferase